MVVTRHGQDSAPKHCAHLQRSKKPETCHDSERGTDCHNSHNFGAYLFDTRIATDDKFYILKPLFETIKVDPAADNKHRWRS